MRRTVVSQIEEKPKEKRQYQNMLWQEVSKNLVQDNKRGMNPSIEAFSQRINLFMRKVDKPDQIQMVIDNEKTLIKSIQEIEK